MIGGGVGPQAGFTRLAVRRNGGRRSGIYFIVTSVHTYMDMDMDMDIRVHSDSFRSFAVHPCAFAVSVCILTSRLTVGTTLLDLYTTPITRH